MIAKMKKAQLLVAAGSEAASLDHWAEFGDFHVDTKVPVLPPEEELSAQFKEAEQAIALAESASGVSDAPLTLEAKQWVEQIHRLSGEIKAHEDRLRELSSEISAMEFFGNFDPSVVEDLAARGFRFFVLTGTGIITQRLDEMENWSYLVAEGGKDRVTVLAWGEQQLPDGLLSFHKAFGEVSSADLKEQLATEQRALADAQGQLAQLSESSAALGPYMDELQAKIAFRSAELSYESHESVSLLTGFVPEASLEPFKAAVSKAGAGLILSEPTEEDEVPTLLKNPKILKLMDPIYKFLDILPGYFEIDFSGWFLLFFSLFFGMIIGDAGYGALFLIGTLITVIKNKGFSFGSTLFAILSTSALVWGAVTGNWFGFKPLVDGTFLQNLVIPELYAFSENDVLVRQMIQQFCFIIGTVHIILAHTLRFFKEIKDKEYLRSFSQLGWMALAISLYHLVILLVVNPAGFVLPLYVVPLIATGAGFVFVFENQGRGKNFFKGVLESFSTQLIPLSLSVIGVFSDIISYIRLFAVGLAGFSIAEAFNSLAMGPIEGGGAGIILGVFVMLIGHGINVVMAGLSVLVHGFRLKTLEFSSHIGVEWKGMQFSPLKPLAQSK